MPVSPAFMQAVYEGSQLGTRIRQQQAQEQQEQRRLQLSWAQMQMRQQAEELAAQQHAAELAQRAQLGMEEFGLKRENALTQQAQFAQGVALDRDKLTLDKEQSAADLAVRGKVLESSALDRAADNKRQDLRDANLDRHYRAVEDKTTPPRPTMFDRAELDAQIKTIQDAPISAVRKPAMIKALVDEARSKFSNPASNPTEIIRKTKDGRKVVFHAITKKPIRYAD